MNTYTKQECDKLSINFIKKLADCNLKKNKDQIISCRRNIYLQNKDFVNNCIINKK